MVFLTLPYRACSVPVAVTSPPLIVIFPFETCIPSFPSDVALILPPSIVRLSQVVFYFSFVFLSVILSLIYTTNEQQIKANTKLIIDFIVISEVRFSTYQ